MNFSPKYQRMNTFSFDYEKKFEKIKRDDKIKFGDDNLLTELKNRKKEMEEKESEEEEEEEEDDDYSDSVTSSDYEGLEMLDVSKELENKGDIMKKKWMENSPKFKNRILILIIEEDMQYQQQIMRYLMIWQKMKESQN
jgi:hypothetical protein